MGNCVCAFHFSKTCFILYILCMRCIAKSDASQTTIGLQLFFVLYYTVDGFGYKYGYTYSQVKDGVQVHIINDTKRDSGSLCLKESP